MAIKSVLVICSIVLTLHAVNAEFNFTTCPAYWEMQAPKVKESFDINKLPGEYYELAFHDYTQYPTCPKPSCIRSRKHFVDIGDADHKMIKDEFSITCFGSGPYDVAYYFNSTDHNGALDGFIKDPPFWWTALFSYTEYPDTVVDFKEAEDGGQYAWVIEIQCRESANWIQGQHVGFTGINFYSRYQNVTDAVYDEMIQAARDAGLGVYMDAGFGTYKVPQDDCKPLPPFAENEDVAFLS